MTQTELTGSWDTDDSDRPDAEAVAVAGDAAQSVAEVVDAADLKFPDPDGTVDLAVTQVDYTVEGQGSDEYPVVHLFGRTPDGTAEHVRVLGFEPYFYAPTATLDDDDLDRDVITRTEPGYESIRGEELTKICTKTPRDVGNIRDEFDHFEADILFPNRLLIDKDIGSGVRVPVRRLESGAIQIPHDEIQAVEVPTDLRVNTFDIEVDDRSGFPEDGEEPIICLTSHDSRRDEYVVWLFDPDTGVTPPEALDGYEPFADELEADVRVFETEEAMLDAYVEYVESETDPDVITGWNCLPGDTPVLLADGTEREIRDVRIGDAVVGDEDRRTTVAEVTDKWQSEKPVLEFTLSDGTSLRSSSEHRIMVGDDDSVDWKEGGDIEPGEYVLKPRKLTVEDESVPVLSELVPIENQRFADADSVKSFKETLPHGAVTDLADQFDLAPGTLYHPRTDVWTPKRCSIAAEKFDIPLPDGGRTYRRTRADLDRQLTVREAYLAGLVLTDGTMSPAEGIRFYNTREELHNQFPGENKLQPDGTGCYKQNVLDYAMLHAFNGLGVPFGDKNDGPVDLSTVYELPEKYIARFLAGVIDGDGNVSNSVTVAAENRSIGRWYAKLFRRLGVYAQQRENVVRVPDAERDIERLKRTVLPHMCHPEKSRALSNLSGGKSGRTEDIPYALFQAESGSDAERIARDKHRRGIALKRHETTVEEWEEYVFVAVESVEQVGTKTTYDIETTTHNFVADDCLVHNCDDFDAPYLIDRMEELQGRHHDYDLNPDRLSRVDEVWQSDWGGPTIKGRVVFDLLYAYKRTQFTELESYRLDAVGEQELGAGKERYAGDIGDLWEEDPERLLEYNLRDVELCVELDRKRDIISFWDEVRTFVGCKLEDAPTPGDAVDVYVLHKVHGDFALPSKGRADAEDYEGGAVFDPITGVKENVSVLDLKCFSGDTGVLTPDGEKNITELEVGDPIYTLNPETFECEIKPVAETHQYENRFGELHHLSGNTHDLKVTENHRFLYSKARGWDDQTPADFQFDEYRSIPEYERFAFPQHEPMAGRSPETFDLIDEVDDGHVVVYFEDDLRSFRASMPDAVADEMDLVRGSSAAMGVQRAIGKYLVPVEVYREYRGVIDRHADDVFLKYGRSHRETPLSVRISDWLELVGWYVTEGSVDRANGRFTIHQRESTHRDAIAGLFDRIGINYSTDERGLNVSNRYLVEWLADNCGEGYADKRLPEWVFDLDADLLSGLLDTMIRGDGSRTDSGLGKFWTKSDHLKDGFVTVAIRCGHKPTVSKQSDGTWYVSAGKRGSFKKATNATVEDHDGDVYCVTAADNHVILAGRNGNYQWVGQSLYPMCMVTINASPETKVDPADYDGDTYHAPNGTHFRKEPDGVIREMVDELLKEREEKKAERNANEPGSEAYEQYDREQQAVKVIMNCFTPDTDVLTPEGVRNIRDLDVGDEVYSLDPETLRMEVKPVTETHAYPDYRGDLVDIETSKIDFSVTPNHRMLVRKDDPNGASWDEFRFVEAGDLNESSHYELPHGWEFSHGDALGETMDLVELARKHTNLDITLSDGGTKAAAKYGTPNVSNRVETDVFLEFLAWYITEGDLYEADTANYRVKIAQEERTERERIANLVDRFVDYYYIDEHSVSFSSRIWSALLSELCGRGSKNKRIPELVFAASREQKERFLDTLIAGDGDRQVNSWRYSTVSERLRDDVLRLCAQLGLTTSYNRDSGTWRIYCTENGKNSFRMHRSGSRSTADDGAYCVTVADNNTLLAGRNGKYQFVGNSLYGVLGWDRFRLYDREMGAAVTATGRDVIEHTQSAANDVGYEVAYGDTDSVMLEIGQEAKVADVPDEIREAHPEMNESELQQIAGAIETGYELEESINDSYDEFALDELNAHHHRFQIEFEKLYRRFFQAGKKKRYAGHIVWKEGKHVDDIDITGFEYKRSDIAPITKEVQRRVIEMIVTGDDVDDIEEYVHDVIEDFEAGNVDLDDVGIPGGIGKRLGAYDTDTAQVRGAKYANLLLGTNFQRGSKPKRLYLKKVHPEFFRRLEDEEGFDPQTDPLYAEFKRDPDVICFEYADQVPDAFEIDWDKMLVKTLKGPIERIIEALGLSWDEVKSGQRQTGLGQF